MWGGHSCCNTSSASGVGRKVWVIRARASQKSSPAGSGSSTSEGTSRLAPAAKAGQISSTETSKPTPATSVARAPDGRRCQATRLASARWSTSTPLGRPVEPEV